MLLTRLRRAVAVVLGPELISDPSFTNAGAWTSVTNGDINTTVPGAYHTINTSAAALATIPAAALLVPGTYHFSGNYATWENVAGTTKPLRITIGGAVFTALGGIPNPGIGVVIPFSYDLVVAAVTDQNIILGTTNNPGRDRIDMLDVSLKQLT